jgi:hypothetical protein
VRECLEKILQPFPAENMLPQSTQRPASQWKMKVTLNRDSSASKVNGCQLNTVTQVQTDSLALTDLFDVHWEGGEEGFFLGMMAGA